MEVDNIGIIRTAEICNSFNCCQVYLKVVSWQILSRIPRIAKMSRGVKLAIQPLKAFLPHRSRLTLLSVVVTPFQ